MNKLLISFNLFCVEKMRACLLLFFYSSVRFMLEIVW